MKKPYRETRVAIFFRPETGKRFKRICKKDMRTYSQQLEVIMNEYEH